MKNEFTDTTPYHFKSRHVETIKNMSATQSSAQILTTNRSDGLSSLQKATVSLMNNAQKHWGFADSPYSVKRQKLNGDIWRLTVSNPKTKETILEVEGQGNKVFEYEDNIARMADALMEKGLSFKTHFDK